MKDTLMPVQTPWLLQIHLITIGNLHEQSTMWGFARPALTKNRCSTSSQRIKL